jgi:hypothetical protein
MIKKLEELNKRRKEVLKFIDLKKIDFNSSRRIIPIEAIKCNEFKWVNYKLVFNYNYFFAFKKYFKANKILFKDKNKVNIKFLNKRDRLDDEMDQLVAEYISLIKQYKIPYSKIFRKIKIGRIKIVSWYSFFWKQGFYKKTKSKTLYKNKIIFLVEIDRILREIKERK